MTDRDRRDFLKVLGAGALAAGVPRWAFARTIDPSHRSRARRCAIRSTASGPRLALGEAKRLGCSYADIRFTRNRSQSIAVRNGQILRGGFGGGGFGGAAAAARPRPTASASA